MFSPLSFGSTVTLYPFTQRYVRSAKRGHIFLLHQFWKCVQLPYSLQQGLINMNSTMIIMSLPIISSQLYYIQFYVFCARAKPQEGLSEYPLTNPEEIWYTDESRFVLDGKRAGYPVVSNFENIEAKHLPPDTSAQLAEPIALT